MSSNPFAAFVRAIISFCHHDLVLSFIPFVWGTVVVRKTGGVTWSLLRLLSDLFAITVFQSREHEGAKANRKKGDYYSATSFFCFPFLFKLWNGSICKMHPNVMKISQGFLGLTPNLIGHHPSMLFVNDFQRRHSSKNKSQRTQIPTSVAFPFVGMGGESTKGGKSPSEDE